MEYQGQNLKNPFFDEMANYPRRFVLPILFADPSGKTNSGSGFLLRLRDRVFGLTCSHVIEKYRSRVAESPIKFQFGGAVLDPRQCLVSESAKLDVAVLDLTASTGAGDGNPESACLTPAAWPPAELAADDVLAFAGFPGTGRERFEDDYYRFQSFSAGATSVETLNHTYLYTKVALSESLVAGGKPEVADNLAGISGGPVFAWRKGAVVTAELIGMAVRYVEEYDLLYVRRLNCLGPDGTLDLDHELYPV